MPLNLESPATALSEVERFIQQTFVAQGKKKAVIAVSGGIDSALSLTLLTQALGAENVTTLFLPDGDQAMTDAELIANFNHIPKQNQMTVNIKPLVDVAAQTLGVTKADQVRLGNLKARARMIFIFDQAKKSEALVCGTENKSEHYLGYFTRFGDAASDLEPLTHWYKTQVRQLAQFLKLPEILISKPPSAGLWSGQTDEDQLGFTYVIADQVLYQLLDLQTAPEEIVVAGATPVQIQHIIKYVTSQNFKLEVPYTL